MAVALDVEDLAIADMALVGHLDVVERVERVEHMNLEVENAEMAVVGHTVVAAVAAAAAAAAADYKLEEHNWDDNSEQTTE
jgi:hypothetical protein